MMLSLHLFEMPFYTVLLQSFICDEDMIDSEYSINGVYCDDSEHYVKVAISAFLLAIYLGYVTLER